MSFRDGVVKFVRAMVGGRPGLSAGSTGKFDVYEVDRGECVRGTAPISVHAGCHGCGTSFIAREHDGMQQIPNGVLLICPSCGERQAISAALFQVADPSSIDHNIWRDDT